MRLHGDHAFTVVNMNFALVSQVLQDNFILLVRVQRARGAVGDTLRQRRHDQRALTILVVVVFILLPYIPPEIEDGNQVQRSVDDDVLVSLHVAGPGQGIVDLVGVEGQCGEAEESHWTSGECAFVDFLSSGG